jgi:hypothetical protein
MFECNKKEKIANVAEKCGNNEKTRKIENLCLFWKDVAKSDVQWCDFESV